MRTACFIFLITVFLVPDFLAAQPGPDDLREFQYRAVSLGKSDWIHWGVKPGVFSTHRNHSNRLIPVYTWGLTLDSVKGENSAYRDMGKLKKIYGFEPKETLNPKATYFDQTELYQLQKKALKSGKKNVIVMIFDGLDWQTTHATSIYKNAAVLYDKGRGTGLGFQDYVPIDAECDFGFCVTAPHNASTKTDVNAQVLTEVADQKFGGYSATFGGDSPWSKAADAEYLIGERRTLPHPFTDSASSATSINTGTKTFNGAINIDASGKQLRPLAHELQEQGRSIGIVTSVPISHATPASAYAHNVSRNDYQDLSRDLLGLKSVSHKKKALPGVDVLIGCGWGEEKENDRMKQGINYIPGNKYLPDGAIRRINAVNGGKYVVAQRTPGKTGWDVLESATKKAIKKKKRLFGYFGTQGGKLPYQTADGNHDPTRGISGRSKYTPEDIYENPTLAQMTSAAISVLERNKKGFFLMVEAGDVDWALHNNNIDDAIGAVLSGETAFEAIVAWVEANSSWDETCLILTADHGHMMILDDPNVLTGDRKLGDEAVFKRQLAAKQKRDAEEKAKQEAKAAAVAKVKAEAATWDEKTKTGAMDSDLKLDPIFNGKNLNGWHNPYDWGKTKIVDNEIQLVADKKFFLMSNLQYNDYVFEGEIRLPEGKSNSGFMLRGQEVKNKVYGYQAEADPTDRKWSGGLYDESRRQWLNPLKDQPEAQEAFKKTDWNKYRIKCEGDHLQVWVNGVLTTDYFDPVDLMGGIGLQHHGEKGQVYRFRNLKAAHTGRHVWKPIFDGSTMEGWKTKGSGKWELKDGVLVGTSTNSENKHGYFFSDASYKDFTARMTFRLSEGNSGLFFRSKPVDSDVGIEGTMAVIQDTESIGGLYEIAGRKWLAKPLHYYPTFSEDRQKGRTKQWKNAHKPGKWSTMVVSAHGDRIVTHVGEILACDFVDPDGDKEGCFAIRLHAKQDMKIEVKSIELLEKQDK